MLRCIRSTVMVLAMWCMPGSVVLQAAAAQLPTPVEQLEEVTVEGQRLYQMRQRIVAAEDRFYSLYNELNKNDEFDVHCANEAQLGTRLAKRSCRAVFLERAQADYGLSIWLTLRGDAGGGTAKSPTLVAMEREQEYQAAMRKVVTDNPSLAQLLRERGRLQQQYDAARRKRFERR